MLRWLNQEGAENPCWYRQGKSQWAASSRRAADEQQSPVVCVLAVAFQQRSDKLSYVFI